MKLSNKVIKNLWLFLLVVLIMLGNGMPVWLIGALSLLILAAPLVREFINPSHLDERQRYIGHFSSHIAFSAYLALLLFVMIFSYVHKGLNPPAELYLLLVVPLVIKFIISLFQNYGLKSAAQGIGYFFSAIWLLFALFSHGFSWETLMEMLPFLVLFFISWLANRSALVSGTGFILLSVALLFFFGGWNRFDVYTRLLMYALIPLPLFLSGGALLLSLKLKEDE